MVTLVLFSMCFRKSLFLFLLLFFHLFLVLFRFRSNPTLTQFHIHLNTYEMRHLIIVSILLYNFSWAYLQEFVCLCFCVIIENTFQIDRENWNNLCSCWRLPKAVMGNLPDSNRSLVGKFNYLLLFCFY